MKSEENLTDDLLGKIIQKEDNKMSMKKSFVIALVSVFTFTSIASAATIADVLKYQKGTIEGDLLTINQAVSFTADGAEIVMGKAQLADGQTFAFELKESQEVDLDVIHGTFQLRPAAVGKYAPKKAETPTAAPAVTEAPKPAKPAVKTKTPETTTDSLADMLASFEAKKAKRAADAESKAEKEAEVEAAKAETKAKDGFDVTDPSTWRKYVSRCKNVRNMSNGLVIMASRNIRAEIPFESIVEKVDTEKGSTWGDEKSAAKRTFSVESGHQATVWFTGPVTPFQKPEIVPETEAQEIDVLNFAQMAELAKVIQAPGAHNGLALVARQPFKIVNVPNMVIKIDHEGGVVLEDADCPIFVATGHQATVWYTKSVTPDGFVTTAPNGKTDASGHVISAEPTKVDISKNFTALKAYGEFWNVDKSKGKGRVFMAHQPVTFTVPGWIAKVDTETGPVFGGKTVTATTGQQITFWGKGAINKR